ncbi:MAG: dinitrogenase iron-molybdenum cofactor biosynthesis protein [Herbinix sp.]|jgi:predicted Fe-Mo cluster-binding NifX family protein|nr:dinitrogenase iron-molybdenum cofactor biosynthesis protein [Herbinix sp.]
MKIALPTQNNKIDSHFGHCEYFTVYSIEETNIISREIVPSPMGCGCKSDITKTLADLGVTTMLAGNIGDKAATILKESGIQVVRGCSGYINEVIQAWLNGEIVDSIELLRTNPEIISVILLKSQ